MSRSCSWCQPQPCWGAPSWVGLCPAHGLAVLDLSSWGMNKSFDNEHDARHCKSFDHTWTNHEQLKLQAQLFLKFCGHGHSIWRGLRIARAEGRRPPEALSLMSMQKPQTQTIQTQIISSFNRWHMDSFAEQWSEFPATPILAGTVLCNSCAPCQQTWPTYSMPCVLGKFTGAVSLCCNSRSCQAWLLQ